VVGDIRPDELKDRTGVELPAGDWETLAGYIIDTLDRVPDVGEVVQSPTACFEVTALSGHAIETVLVTRTTSAG
jgi:CBS domain containing-hemolysin-like protein